MFKRSLLNVLPERPPLPTPDQVLDDIKSAKPDDVVFQISAERDSSTKKSPSISDDMINFTFGTKSIEFENPYQAYQKVNAFVEKMDHFEKQIRTIDEQLQNIEQLKNELEKNISDTKTEIKNSEVL